MTYQYAYRDSANVRHDGTVAASSKDDAFRKLKARGVRPFFVAPAPGLRNRILGFGKRGFAIVVLGVGCLVLGYFVLIAPSTNVRFVDSSIDRLKRTKHQAPSTNPAPSTQLEQLITSQVRRQPIGDAAVIDQGIRTGWADVFALEGERFLASFAVPGAPAGQRSTTEGELRKALSTPARDTPPDGLEARQICAMVEGMKAELRKYLADGGTIAEYGRELVARQEAEIAQRQRARTILEEDIRQGRPESEIIAELETVNRRLRRMGIKPLTLPE